MLNFLLTFCNLALILGIHQEPLCFILTLLGSLEGVTHAEQAVPVGAESLSPKEWASIEEQIAAVAEPQNSDLTSTPIAKLQATPPIVNDNLGWVVSVQGDIAAVVGNGPQAEGRVYILPQLHQRHP